MKNDKPKPVKMSIFNHTPKNNYMICEKTTKIHHRLCLCLQKYQDKTIRNVRL